MQTLQAKSCRYPSYLRWKQEDYFLTVLILRWQALRFFFSEFHNCCEFSKPPIPRTLLSANPQIFFKCIFKQIPVIRTAGEKKTNKAWKMIERTFSIQNTTWKMACSQRIWGFISLISYWDFEKTVLEIPKVALLRVKMEISCLCDLEKS